MKYYLFASGVYLLASVIVVPLALGCGVVAAFGSGREFWRVIQEGLAEYKAETTNNTQIKELLDELESTSDKPLDIWDRHVARMEQKNKSEGK